MELAEIIRLARGEEKADLPLKNAVTIWRDALNGSTQRLTNWCIGFTESWKQNSR